MTTKKTAPKAAVAKPNPVAAVEVVEAASSEIETIATEAVETARHVIEEGMIEMPKQANEAITGSVQALFGDVNVRARAALEKNARVVEEITELTRGNVEALVTSSKVAARGVEALGQEAAEYGRKSFEEVSTAFRGFAEVKSPTDFVRLQSEFAKNQFDSMVSESSKLSEAFLKLAGEVFEPLSSRYSVAAERVKTVAAA